MYSQLLSCVQFFETPWTAAHQAPLSMEFSRQKYWSGLPFPPPGDLPDPGIEPGSPASPSPASTFLPTVPPGKCSTQYSVAIPAVLPSETILHIVYWNYISFLVQLFVFPGVDSCLIFLFSVFFQHESKHVSHSVVSDSLGPPWTVTRQAPLSMKFSRQEYWSG